MRNDAERLKEFRKLKEVIGTDPNYLIVGIDKAKLRHHACFLLSSGKIVARNFRFIATLGKALKALLIHSNGEKSPQNKYSPGAYREKGMSKRKVRKYTLIYRHINLTGE